MQQTQALKDVLVRMGITAEFEARGIERGMEKGIAIGETKGMEKGIEKVALRMKKRGVAIEQIAEDTGLSPNEIVRL
ncbi:hypothetical protein ACYULU_05615 [Breznakiellaceae bacterium SP9]